MGGGFSPFLRLSLSGELGFELQLRVNGLSYGNTNRGARLIRRIRIEQYVQIESGD